MSCPLTVIAKTETRCFRTCSTKGASPRRPHPSAREPRPETDIALVKIMRVRSKRAPAARRGLMEPRSDRRYREGLYEGAGGEVWHRDGTGLVRCFLIVRKLRAENAMCGVTLSSAARRHIDTLEAQPHAPQPSFSRQLLSISAARKPSARPGLQLDAAPCAA